MVLLPFIFLLLTLGASVLECKKFDPEKKIYYENGVAMYDGKPIGPLPKEKPLIAGRTFRNMSEVLASKYYTSFELMNKDEKLINGTFRQINGTLVNMNSTFDFLNDTHVKISGKVWDLYTIFPKLPHKIAKDFSKVSTKDGNLTKFGARCVFAKWPIIKIKSYQCSSDCNYCECCNRETRPWTYRPQRPPCTKRWSARPPCTRRWPTKRPYYSTTRHHRQETVSIPTILPPEEPTEYPTEEPTEYPTEETTEYPTEETTEYPTEETTEYSTEEPTEYPTEETTEYPTEEPTEYPTEETTEYPTEESTEYPTEETTEYPTEETTEHHTEETTEHHTEETTEHHTEETTEHHTEEPTEHHTEEPTEHPTEETTEHHTEETTEHHTEEPTEHHTEETTEHHTEEPTEHPTEETTEHHTEETTEHHKEGTTEHHTEEPTEHHTEGTTEHHTDKPTETPNNNIAKPEHKTTEYPTEKTTENSTEYPLIPVHAKKWEIRHVCAVHEMLKSSKTKNLDTRQTNVLSAFLQFVKSKRMGKWKDFQKFYTKPAARDYVAELALRNVLLKQVSNSAGPCEEGNCCQLKKLGRTIVLRAFHKWMNSADGKDITDNFLAFVKSYITVENVAVDIDSLVNEMREGWKGGKKRVEFRKINEKCREKYPGLMKVKLLSTAGNKY